MSYEGTKQVLCHNGHYFEYDSYDFVDLKLWSCDICGAPAEWHNSVDQTNGCYCGCGKCIDGLYEDGSPCKCGECTNGRIDGYIELEEKEKDICPTCGQITKVTYKIPKDK